MYCKGYLQFQVFWEGDSLSSRSVEYSGIGGVLLFRLRVIKVGMKLGVLFYSDLVVFELYMPCSKFEMIDCSSLWSLLIRSFRFCLLM